mmetsp:Transcript_32980/g.83736  ORF Transcript_32980/g.83736 Transcript_32980/m.83736 type:complete len:103 (-) Transcript_32980:176-484(-)
MPGGLSRAQYDGSWGFQAATQLNLPVCTAAQVLPRGGGHHDVHGRPGGNRHAPKAGGRQQHELVCAYWPRMSHLCEVEAQVVGAQERARAARAALRQWSMPR